MVAIKDMKEMPTKFHLIIPISISESNDKAPFVDFETNSEMINYLGKRVYIDSYETAVKNAKFLSKKYKIDIAVVEVKNIIEVK